MPFVCFEASWDSFPSWEARLLILLFEGMLLNRSAKLERSPVGEALAAENEIG